MKQMQQWSAHQKSIRPLLPFNHTIRQHVALNLNAVYGLKVATTLAMNRIENWSNN